MVTGTKWFIFLKQEYSKAWNFDGDTLCTLCYSLYNAHDTHSVHNYLLKSWWSRLLRPRSPCYVFPPPLSGINWRSLPLPGGPGPPTPKVASLFPGSAHTPSPRFRTIHCIERFVIRYEWLNNSFKIIKPSVSNYCYFKWSNSVHCHSVDELVPLFEITNYLEVCNHNWSRNHNCNMKPVRLISLDSRVPFLEITGLLEVGS